MEKEKVKEKVGKKSGAPAPPPPKKEAKQPKGYLPAMEDLESVAKVLKLTVKTSASRCTLWTSNSVRVLKLAGNSISVTFPTEKAVHVSSKKELTELLRTVVEEAAKAPARVPPTRKKAEKKSTEAKVKEKVEKKAAPKPEKAQKAPAKEMLIKPEGVKPKKKMK